MYKHPVHPIGEARYFRHFLWRTGFSPTVEHLSPISYFLSLFGIEENITRRRATEFHFQHRFMPVHIKVKLERNGFRVNAHIDVVSHLEVRYSAFTSILMADLSTYLQLKYKDSAIGFYIPPTEKCEHKSEKLQSDIVEIDSEPSFEVARIQVNRIVSESLDSRNLDEIKQRNDQFIRNLITQYQKEVQNLIREKIQKELERKKREELITQKTEELEDLRASWRVLCKEIIDFCLEEKVLELLSNQVYKIVPRHVKKKIREMVFLVLGEICDDEKGFLILDFRELIKTYFSVKLDEMQEFLDDEQEKVERARIEEERRIQSILVYIDDFLASELRVISRYYLGVEYYQLPKDLMKQFLLEGFNEKLLNDGITEREEYKEHFRSVLSSRFKDCLKKLNNRVKELKKLQTKTSLREYIKDHIILLIVILFLTAFLIGYFVWFFSLPYLIRFSFETANLWIHPVIGTIIGIDIILLILLFNRN